MNTNQPTNPPNPEVILKRFRKEASSSDESSSSVLIAEDWFKIKIFSYLIAKDTSSKELKKLQRSLHHISVQNTLLRGEIQGLGESLKLKKRHKKKGYKLQFNNDEEYHGGAQFWSPRKIKRAKDDEMIRRQQQQQQQELQLQKTECRQLKEQARLHKLQQAQEKRVERERVKEVREKERAEKLSEKERQKAARDAEKAIQLSQKGKRSVSQASTQKQKRQKCVVDLSDVQAEVAEPPVPTQTTRHGRTTKVPSKYK